MIKFYTHLFENLKDLSHVSRSPSFWLHLSSFSTFTGEFYESDDESSDDESIPSPTGSPPPEAGAREFQNIILFKQLNFGKICMVRINIVVCYENFSMKTIKTMKTFLCLGPVLGPLTMQSKRIPPNQRGLKI